MKHTIIHLQFMGGNEDTWHFSLADLTAPNSHTAVHLQQQTLDSKTIQ